MGGPSSRRYPEVPFRQDLEAGKAKIYMMYNVICGQIAGAITEEIPAKQIVQDMILNVSPPPPSPSHMGNL